MSKSIRRMLYVTGAVLLFSVLACSLPPSDGSSVIAEPTQEMPADAPPSTDVPPPTTVPTAAPGFVFSGISLTFTPDIATGGTGENVPAYLEEGPVGPTPALRRITLSGGVISDPAMTPVIVVFSPSEYTAVNEYVAAPITLLEELINGTTLAENVDNLPYLPAQNAAQMFSSNVALLSFANGQGVRYVTQYSQAIMPVSNRGLFYTFQGLTADGKWYVSVTVPVSHIGLPQDDSIPGDDFDAFAANFETYLTETATMLDQSLPEAFTPTLTSIDAMIKTILVE